MSPTKKEQKKRSNQKLKDKSNFISEEEYLEKELLAETKSEYQDGKVVAMAGATLIHNIIVSKLTRHLGNCFEKLDCEVVSSDLLIHIDACKKYVYPDVVVICKTPKFAKKSKGRAEALINPQIIIEVLSKSTAEKDLGEKLRYYLQLESLEQYIIVSSERKLIIVYTKGEDSDFRVKTYQEGEEIPIGQCQISADKIYHKVEFEEQNQEKEE